MILDLSANETAAKIKILKVVPKRSGSDDGKLVCDVEVSCKIDGEDDAAILARFAPGAVALYRAGASARTAAALKTSTEGAAAGAADANNDGTFGDLVIKLPENSRRTRVHAKLDAGEFDLGPASIRGALRFKSTPKASIVVYKLRLDEVEGEEVGALSDMLDMLCDIALKREQKVLDFPKKTADEIAPEVGQVISGVDDGAEYSGIVLGFADDEGISVIEIDDCGTVSIVRAASVSGALTVVCDDGLTLEDVLSDYVSASSEAGTEASWQHLVVALGQHYLAAGQASDGGWVITSDILHAALDVAAA